MGALYSHTTRSDGLTLTAAIYNADHQNHIDNGIPAQLDDYSTNATTMATTTDPGESGSESLATSLAGELERIRFILLEHGQALSGTTLITKWYSSPTNARYINDTSNVDVTTGLTINQGAADDQIFALKSSDVAHGVTDVTETDTYGFAMKHSATEGGLLVQGVSEGTTGLRLTGLHTTDDATRSTSGRGAVRIQGKLKSGTGQTDLAADRNIVSFETNTTTRFILDSDGDSHQDVGLAWTNFDDHDDVMLLDKLSASVARKGDPLRERFGSFLEEYREDLTAIQLVSFNPDGHHFVNMSRLAMLNTGAIRQLSSRMAMLSQRLAAVELAALPSR